MSDHFDWIFYLNFYRDLKANGYKTEEEARKHYQINGTKEQRICNFNVGAYLKSSDKKGDCLFKHVNDTNFLRMNTQIMSAIFKHLTPQSRTLEINCGIACLSLPIIKFLEPEHYWGIDTDTKCVEWCLKHIDPLRKSTFTTYDEPKIPHENDSFDLVFSSNCLMTIKSETLEPLLCELARILKPNGVCILSLFMWNHQIPLNTYRKDIKVRKHHTSYYLQKDQTTAIIHTEATILKTIEKAHLTLKETFCGSWTNYASSYAYQDLIVLTK
jgi:SAM-dependent methyltransferase